MPYRVTRANGTIAKVYGRASIIRDADGKAYHMYSGHAGSQPPKGIGRKPEQELKLKEKQIGEAVEGARKTERSDIGRELHDNVNQLLGASGLYLNMSKHGGKDSEINKGVYNRC